MRKAHSASGNGSVYILLMAPDQAGYGCGSAPENVACWSRKWPESSG